MRHPDSPKYKEPLCSQLFGQALGIVQGFGWTRGQQFEYRSRPILDCSQKILWLDQADPQYQMTLSIKSTDCSLEFGVVRKIDKEVLYRKKVESLRYKISEADSPELTPKSTKAADDFLADFSHWGTALRDGTIQAVLATNGII